MFPVEQIESKLIPKNIVSIKIIQNSLDFFVLILSFWLAYELRFDFSLPPEIKNTVLGQSAFVAIYLFLILRAFGVHKFIWRHISLAETKKISYALLAAALPLLVLRLIPLELPMLLTVPLSIIVLYYFLAVAGILGLRLLRREIYASVRLSAKPQNCKARRRIMLIGAGRAGALTLAEIKTGNLLNYEVKGFIDDDSLKQGLVINGVKVIGKTGDIPQKARDHKIDEVIITIATASRKEIRRILDICAEVPVKVKTIPALSEILSDKIVLSRIRDVEVEDLLGRAAINLDRHSIEAFLSEKTVLVTGAGGSIGSELVRQIINCQPSTLILVERAEFALFNIEREIRALLPACEIVPALADICDRKRMSDIFQRFAPAVVFHAAAHKHVPMTEINAAEALRNNAFGTQIVGELAAHHRAEAFVLISTDKAVNPTSVMGATKRTAELIIQEFNARFCETRFVAVRFGNVINSNGSVVPIFREQIKAGGPVTVTHPEMRRFFMTIPEASQLVLQAGALAAGGEIFLLDMGEPVKILDLARETIRLSGFEPDEDIQIVFTGIRPGEKLREDLESDWEQLEKTVHSKINIARIQPQLPAQEITRLLARIENIAAIGEESLVRYFLSRLLPEAQLNIQPMLISDCKQRSEYPFGIPDVSLALRS
jgi:FlaA1/EpsC-like NDP-sugar epimerase